jgi:hypothetical protein
MDFLPLSLLFAAAGGLAMVYYQLVLKPESLKARLPNRVSGAAIVLAVVIAAVVIYIVRTRTGFGRISAISTFIFALLAFESAFLLLLRWVKSNTLAVLFSLAVSGTLFALNMSNPTFELFNAIVIFAAFGASTLLIRLRYLRTSFLFIVAGLWTIYDILSTQFLLPRIFVPAAEPVPTKFFIFPAVTIGHTTLGSGDFMFLVLFTLVMLRDLGKLPAAILVAAETAGLLITGLLITNLNKPLPFLVIMTPIFVAIYVVSRILKQRTIRTN